MVKFDLDKIFNVLRHPARRKIIEHIARESECGKGGWIPFSDIAALFDLSLPAIMKHLDVLEESSIISSAKEAHVRYYALNAKPLAVAADWFDSVISY